MKSSLSLAALALAASVCAEDVLFSKRMTKRFIDDDGNYNMCKSAKPPPPAKPPMAADIDTNCSLLPRQ